MKSQIFKNFVTLQRGFDLPKKDMEEGDYPVIGSTNIIGYHNEYKVEPPGVITGRSGSLGQVQYIDEPYWPHNTALWVRDFKGNYPKYVYYFLKTLDLARFNAGAGVPTLNRNHLDELEISIHEPKMQHRIADILSAYDDLIENNNRRILILENIAQAIYHEWFGSIETLHATFLPTGWEIKKLGDVANVNNESITKNDEPETINYIDIASVSTGKIEKTEIINFDNAPSRARRIVRHGDIIWSSVRPNRKSYSLIIEPSSNTIVSTGFAVIRAFDIPFSYLYFAITTDDFVGYLTNHARGAAYPAVNASDFENAEILVPRKDTLEKFDNQVLPIMLLQQKLIAKNANLRQTRDLLLPRLVSGEVVVSSLS